MSRFTLRLIAVAILAAGLTAATMIYFIADDAPPVGATTLVINGETYSVDPGTNRAYVRELQRFGGKTSVLFDDFIRWFAGLWQGKELVATIGVISAAVSGVFFSLSRRS